MAGVGVAPSQVGMQGPGGGDRACASRAPPAQPLGRDPCAVQEIASPCRPAVPLGFAAGLAAGLRSAASTADGVETHEGDGSSGISERRVATIHR